MLTDILSIMLPLLAAAFKGFMIDWMAKKGRKMFTVPQMPLRMNVYTGMTVLPGVPRLTDVPVNLAVGRRIAINMAESGGGGEDVGLQMWGLIPRGVDVHVDPILGPDILEIPMWSQRYYELQDVDYAGAGFTNTHQVATLEKVDGWPIPYPDPNLTYSPPPPPPVGLVYAFAGNTIGIPVNTFNMPFTLPVAGSVYLIASWENVAGVPAIAGPAAGVIGGTLANAVLGGVNTSMAIFAFGVLAPGVYNPAWTFPLFAFGQAQWLICYVPAGVAAVSGPNAGACPPLFNTAATLLTTTAPMDVGYAVIEAGVAGPPIATWMPGTVTTMLSSQELVGLQMFRLNVGRKWELANGLFTATETTGAPLNGALFSASMLG